MDDYKKLADLIFPDIKKSVADYEKEYPERNLKEGERGITFEETHFGVIAQELAELLPVGEFAAVKSDENETLSVAYYQLIGPLISAVQELSKRIKELEERK